MVLLQEFLQYSYIAQLSERTGTMGPHPFFVLLLKPTLVVA
jgi:hypothetical protein